MIDVIEKSTNVQVQYPVHLLPLDSHRQRIQRLMLAAPGPEPIGDSLKVFLVDLIQNARHGLLDDFVLQYRHAQRALPPIAFQDIHPPGGLRAIRPPMHAVVKIP